MSEVDPSSPGAGTIPHCYRHPDRETYISCQRCGRPICPNCMLQASVGFQCPECVKVGASQTRPARTVFGGRITDGSTPVTLGLIVLNVVFFLIANATDTTHGEFSKTLGLIPDASGYAPQLGLEGVAQGSYWQLVTSTFLHFGILHLVMNMIGLWIFGSFLESALGRSRFLALYLLSGLAGSVAVYLLAAANSYSLGASGSVFGLFGASLVVLLRQRRDITQLLLLLGLNLVISFTVPDVSWPAHIGGLVTGFAMGAGYAYAPRQYRGLVHAGMVVGVLVVSALLVATRTAALTV